MDKIKGAFCYKLLWSTLGMSSHCYILIWRQQILWF